MNQSREKFDSNLAAVLALAGSAIGLGNIWRFPYITGQHGGAAFIIIYMICSCFIALPIFFSEAIIGRSTSSSTFGAIEKIAPGSRWRYIGLICIITPLIILSYYSVVGGWSVAYLVKSTVSSFGQMTQQEVSSIFSEFTGSVWLPVLCHTVFLLISILVVKGGVKKGIQKLSQITMPALFVIMILLMFYSLSMPGSMEGVKYLIKPDFSKIDGPAIAAALGQSFFSLSLGVGTVLTYSSYMSAKDNIITTGGWTVLFDLSFALIAGFVIMPAVFAANLQPSSGPGLVFESLPFIFAQIGGVSPLLAKVVTVAFFLAILMAALTSEVSMIEVCTAYLVEEKNMKRGKATALVFVVGWLIGTCCSVFPKLFDACDFVASNVLMMIGALAFCLFVGWRMKKAVVRRELTGDGSQKIGNVLFKPIYFLIRYVAPVAIVAIFVSNFIS